MRYDNAETDFDVYNSHHFSSTVMQKLNINPTKQEPEVVANQDIIGHIPFNFAKSFKKSSNVNQRGSTVLKSKQLLGNINGVYHKK